MPIDTDEHPLATKLYRRFKPGSDTMTKAEAYDIGNELDRMHRELVYRREKMRNAEATAEISGHRGPDRYEQKAMGVTTEWKP